MGVLSMSGARPSADKIHTERSLGTVLGLLSLLKGSEASPDFGLLCRRALAKHRVAMEVRGPVPVGPAVLVANHLSWLDPLLIRAITKVAAIGKAELARWPYFGSRLREAGVIFVDRGDPFSGARALLQAARVLKAGGQVLNFPEGTTTRGDLLPFHRGIFQVALRLEVEVVPIRIEIPPELHWVGEANFLPHYLRLAGRPETMVRVHLAPPLGPAPSAQALAERARESIRGLA